MAIKSVKTAREYILHEAAYQRISADKARSFAEHLRTRGRLEFMGQQIERANTHEETADRLERLAKMMDA